MESLNIHFAPYQIITTLFCLLMILKVISRYKRRERSLKELIVWIAIWSAIGFFAFFPTVIDYISGVLGVKSGAVGLLAIWLILLTYAFFRTFVVVEGIDKKITDLARKSAFDGFELKKVVKKDKRKTK